MMDSAVPMMNGPKPRRLAASAPPHPPPTSRPAQFLSYMHRPPRIVPNYGKRRRGVLPKSSVSRVLLYDNVTQQQMLHVKMTHLGAEQRKTGRLMDMHRKSFITRRQQKERQMAETALHVDHDLLERGLLSTGIPRNGENKARPESSQTFNPYVEAENDSNGNTDPQFVENHVTSQLTNEIVADDSSPQRANGVWAERRETSLQFLSVDRRKAVTTDCLVVPPPLPAQTDVHRTALTARTQRETREQDYLPDIHAVTGQPPRMGKILTDSQQPDGLTRLLHTFNHQDSFDGGSRKSGKGRGGKMGGGSEGRTMEDERYRMLERVLVRIEPPNEGYLELSPSFHSPRQTMTFTRPSSLHSSVYRRRSSSSSSSVLTRPFSIQIQDL